ncbi:MAG: hypothetical protein K0T00_2649 [Gaiellaceae bacterium]|nr:hypothetical protein [Gaiellaceae bacterium]
MDIGNSVERGFTEFFAWLPALLGALAILVIGYFVAKFVSRLVWRALHRAGFDRTLHSGQGGSFVQKVTSSPSKLVGTLAFWAILLGAISLSVTALGIEALTDFVAAVYAYLPNVLAAVLIFLVAGAISAAVATLVTRTMGETSLGRIVATAAPILVMTIATFMILDQLMIAESIVTITYAGLIGAIALGSALAFGLGGREVARELLQGAYEKGRENKDQFRRDLDQGISRAREEAVRGRESTSDGDDGSVRRDTPETDRLATTPAAPPAPLDHGVEPTVDSSVEPAFEPVNDRDRTRGV